MLFEIASGETPLPGSGPRWDFLRSGRVPPVPTCSANLATLITAGMAADPHARPAATHVMAMTVAAVTDAAVETGGRR